MHLFIVTLLEEGTHRLKQNSHMVGGGGRKRNFTQNSFLPFSDTHYTTLHCPGKIKAWEEEEKEQKGKKAGKRERREGLEDRRNRMEDRGT